MDKPHLIINDQTVDLSDDSVIALTFQVNDLADLKDRQSTFTNSIKLPPTFNNRRVFGFPETGAITQDQPYKYQKVKVIQNGIETVPNGVATLTSVNGDFETSITSGLTGFADIIGNKKISVLPFTQANFNLGNSYNLPGVVSSQNNTWQNVFIWSVFSYGISLDPQIDIRYMRPAMFTYAILKEIETYTGYKFAGKILQNEDFLKEIIQHPAKENVGGNPTINDNLPNVEIKAFLKDLMQRYFLTPVVDNISKIITFRNFDELYLNKSKAKDWTKKFVQSDKVVSFKIGTYGQTSTLVYTTDEFTGVEGNGSFEVENKTLPDTKEIVKSIYAYSGKTFFTNTGFVSRIQKLDTDPTEFSLDTVPRVFYNAYNQQSVTFIDSTSGATQTAPQISAPVFEGQEFATLLSNYGQGLLKLLKKVRVETKQAVLSSGDVQNFDHFIPVYDQNDSCYYYVNKIDSWRPNKTVKVTLVKM
jgi:hypothetical protein